MGLRSWLLESEEQGKPIKEVMARERQSLTDWLHRSNLSVDEIRETLPELYQDIQDAEKRLDKAYAQEDLPTFQSVLERLKTLYAEALSARRKVGVKVYSEILGCYLWIVRSDEDMHFLRSQGVTETIYTQDEIRRLKGLDRDSLKEIHKVKEAFPESKVEEIIKRKAHKDGDQSDATLWG